MSDQASEILKGLDSLLSLVNEDCQRISRETSSMPISVDHLRSKYRKIASVFSGFGLDAPILENLDGSWHIRTKIPEGLLNRLNALVPSLSFVEVAEGIGIQPSLRTLHTTGETE